MSVKNDFQQNDVERCLNRDNSMYIHICVFRHSTIQCIYVNINIYIHTCLHVRFMSVSQNLCTQKAMVLVYLYQSCQKRLSCVDSI